MIVKNLPGVKQEDLYLFPSIWARREECGDKTHCPKVAWGTKSSNDPAVYEEWRKKYSREWSRVYFCIDLYKSNLSVIDVDIKNGKDGDNQLAALEAEHGPLPPTLKVQTPSGGFHYFFRGPIGNRGLAKAIDTPMMVPVPGSNAVGKGKYEIIENGPIASVPAWVGLLAGNSKERAKKGLPPLVELDLPHNVERAAEYLANARVAISGKRGNDTTYWTACKVKDYGVSPKKCFELMMSWNEKCIQAWSFGELEEIINNAYGYGRERVGVATCESEFGAASTAPDLQSKREKGAWPFVLPRGDMITESGDMWDWRETAPKCIIKNFLFSDIAILSGPGGTGKTTLMLYEAIHIATGIDLYGLKVERPGWTLFVSAEDPTKYLRARMRNICEELMLSPEQMEKVKRRVLFCDVTGKDAKFIKMEGGNVVSTGFANKIVETYHEDPPRAITFDPIVSFGVGESRVNDNEQGIISACREINNGLNCAIRLITHTGQTVARENIQDQYASRGGTALPDGSRMVSVLQHGTEGNKNAPDKCTFDEGSSVMVLSRPKLSYAPPNLPRVWIRRKGWSFEWFIEERLKPEERKQQAWNKIIKHIQQMEEDGEITNLSKTRIVEAHALVGLTRRELKQGIDELIAARALFEVPAPNDLKKGRFTRYISARAPEKK